MIQTIIALIIQIYIE